ncbi:MAG: hypothetical protein JXB32_19485 [Deltaproteobacteria bacterium]|nr:hypothetical protein [Deltaproteobacteria bacterium]
MRVLALSVLCGWLFLPGCGPRAVEHEIEERPLDQATALDAIQQAFGERDVQSERFVPVTLPDGSNYVLDVAGSNLPVAVEFLTSQDRERVGDQLPIPADPDETPRLVVVRRQGMRSPEADLYLRVFTDEHFRFQPNPPSDMPAAPYTIREVTARLRRDVKDFASWYRANHAAPGAASP